MIDRDVRAQGNEEPCGSWERGTACATCQWHGEGGGEWWWRSAHLSDAKGGEGESGAQLRVCCVHRSVWRRSGLRTVPTASLPCVKTGGNAAQIALGAGVSGVMGVVEGEMQMMLTSV